MSWDDDLAGLGHTRLAVIDTSADSDQPMTDEASGCTLVFNGEIYNYLELRTELERLGHRFRSAGDTEVLLRSYLEWGRACVTRLNGMFAFAVRDPRAGSVLLARDRLGEKPLHLARSGSTLWFASEVKALLATGDVPARARPAALCTFLALGDVARQGETFFDGVDQLRAGHIAEITRAGAISVSRYWTLPAVTEATGLDRAAAASTVAEEFTSLFDDAVRLRLRSDVPLGTSLSGGLDSSAVLGSLRRFRPDGELHAFTASFPGTAVDELTRAREVADRLGATIHPVPLVADDLDAGIEPLIRAHEGPVGSSSVFAQYRVMEEARCQGITVLLDGQGADETWGGYDKYWAASVIDQALRGRWSDARRRRSEWTGVRSEPPRIAPARYVGLVSPPRLRTLMSRSDIQIRQRWLAADFTRQHARWADPLGGLEGRASTPGQVADDYGRIDITHLLLPRLLQFADRNSMAWSREVRLPFLDHRLVELAARTGIDAKVVSGWSKEPVRRHLSALGLESVARRRDKLAYQPPHETWMSTPAMAERVRAAWTALHRAGLLAGREPSGPVLRRWRVLAVSAWIDAFDVGGL